MGWHGWDRYERRPPRRADGIKARTQRGQFGKSWWAGRWIAALERLVDSGRLGRGRSYARGRQVTELEVGPEGVQAAVQGSRPRPYDVTVRFKRLTDAEWEEVAGAMAAEAIYAARLLSGEMPEGIEDAFSAAGTSLFPAERGDIETDCSCPDWANPCKHVAAVHYLLGERFEEDPFLIFELRGRTKEQIAEALRARRAGAVVEETPAETDEPAQAEESPAPMLGDSAEAFWEAGAGLASVAISFREPEIDALPVKRLGPPPFWRGRRNFTELMEQAYRDVSARARRIATGDE